jgi:hypothetical protein
MQWKCLPILHDVQGKSAIYSTTIYHVLATCAGDGALWQAFLASVQPLAKEKHLDRRVLHGNSTILGLDAP